MITKGQLSGSMSFIDKYKVGVFMGVLVNVYYLIIL
jgi:hypothetical protein